MKSLFTFYMLAPHVMSLTSTAVWLRSSTLSIDDEQSRCNSKKYKRTETNRVSHLRCDTLCRNIKIPRDIGLQANILVTYTIVMNGVILIQNYARYLLANSAHKKSAQKSGKLHVDACKTLQKLYRQRIRRKQLTNDTNDTSEANILISYTNVICGVISIQNFIRHLISSGAHNKQIKVYACIKIQKLYRQWKLRKQLEDLRTFNFAYLDTELDVNIDIDDMLGSINNLVFQETQHVTVHSPLKLQEHRLQNESLSNLSNDCKDEACTQEYISDEQQLIESQRPQVSINEIMFDWNVTNVTLAKVRFQNVQSMMIIKLIKICSTFRHWISKNILRRKHRITKENHSEAAKGNRFFRRRINFMQPHKTK